MKAIKLDFMNLEVAKNQPQYNTLPARYNHRNGTVLTVWEFTPEEIELIKNDGKLWLRCKTFGKPLQPLLLEIKG